MSSHTRSLQASWFDLFHCKFVIVRSLNGEDNNNSNNNNNNNSMCSDRIIHSYLRPVIINNGKSDDDVNNDNDINNDD